MYGLDTGPTVGADGLRSGKWAFRESRIKS